MRIVARRLHDAGLGVLGAQRAAWLALQAMEVDGLGRVEVTGGSVPGAPNPDVADGLDADAVEAGEHVCAAPVATFLKRLVLKDNASILFREDNPTASICDFLCLHRRWLTVTAVTGMQAKHIWQREVHKFFLWESKRSFDLV